MFCNFYLVKNHEIADNSATAEAREKNKHRFGILRNLKKLASLEWDEENCETLKLLFFRKSYSTIIFEKKWIMKPLRYA